MKKKKAFNGSEHRSSVQHRITEQDENSNVLNRTTLKQVPRRLEALYIAFAKDASNSDLILTREELDLNPATRLLPDREKDLLVKYWPSFQEKATTARAVAKVRQQQINTLSKDHKEANLIKRKHGMQKMSVPNKLRAAAHVATGVLFESSLTLSATPPLTENTTDLEKAMWKERAQRLRDLAFIAKTSFDLADRIEEVSTDEMQSAELTDEAQQALQDANAKLDELGYGYLSDAVAGDGDDE